MQERAMPAKTEHRSNDPDPESNTPSMTARSASILWHLDFDI
jgi:hypothetical protein